MNREELHPLLRRALIFLENGDNANADDYCEKYLDIEPEGAVAYVIKLMIRAKVTREEDLATAEKSFRGWSSYQNACRFADPELRQRLEQYLLTTEKEICRKEEERIAQEQEAELEKYYQQALKEQASNNTLGVQEAMCIFREICEYKDSAVRIEQCKETLARLQEEKQKQEEENKRNEKARKRKETVITTIVIFGIAAIVILLGIAIDRSHQNRIPLIEKNLRGSYSATYIEGDIYDGGGVISTYETVEENEIYYLFKKDNKGIVEKTIRYDEYPFLIHNGEREWESIDHEKEAFTWENLSISFLGKITVEVDGKECELTVDSENQPQSIIIDGITYERN